MEVRRSQVSSQEKIAMTHDVNWSSYAGSSYILIHLISAEEAPLPSLDRADAVVAIIMHALTPS